MIVIEKRVDMKWLIAPAIFLASVLATADSHTDAALAHINATALQDTFALTRGGVMQRLEQYEQQFLSSPSVLGKPEAMRLTQNFITAAKAAAEEIYAWERVEVEYVEALKRTYTEKELLEINDWLGSKYGQIFITKQNAFMRETIDIINDAGQLFELRIRPVERAYFQSISELSP